MKRLFIIPLIALMAAAFLLYDAFSPDVYDAWGELTYTVDGVTYYNFSTSTYTVPAGVEDHTPMSGIQNFTFNWDMDETGGDAPTAGGGWWTSAIIPEPMTVLCGLAGLALLLKRRA